MDAMSPLPTVLTTLLLLGAAWYLPGRMLLGPSPDRPAGERHLLAFGVGLAATSLLAFAGALLLEVPLGRLGVLVAALAVAVAGATARVLGRPGRRPASSPSARPAGEARDTLWLLAVLLAAAWVALGRFEPAELHMTCENYPTALLLGLEIGAEPRPSALRAVYEQRLGTSAVVAPTVALLGIAGFRIAYAATLLLIVGGTHRLLVGLGAGPKLAGMGALLVLFQPLMAEIVEVDPNLNALAFIALAFVLLRPGPAPRPVLAALAFGLVFASRYVLAPGALALLALAWGRVGRRGAAAAAAMFLLTCMPLAAHNFAAHGTPFTHPSLELFPEPQPHSFVGIPFELRTTLNWPFTERVVRSPFNPHPTVLMFLERIGAGLGVLGIALVTLGAWCALRRDPRLTWALLAFGMPTAMLFAVLENWTEPTRLWLLVNLLLPVLVLAPLGVGALASDLRRRRLGPPTAALAAAALFWVGLTAAMDRTREVPVDPRILAAYPFMPPERPHEIEILREQYGPPGLLPRLASVHMLRGLAPARVAATLRELAYPDLADHPVPFAQEVVSWIWPERYAEEFAAPFFGPPEPIETPTEARLALRLDLTAIPTIPGHAPLDGGGPAGRHAGTLVGRVDPLEIGPCKPSWSSSPIVVHIAGRGFQGSSVAVVLVVERPDLSESEPPSCREEDLQVEFAVPPGTGAVLFYVRQTLPTVVFQRGGWLDGDELRLEPRWRKV
jgi:hypothetical protein